ncbi:CHASE2 domain-containing protein [Atlanticothrix silvestris]|uniref:CHASE2 domain-containing protein n=1 Tax=Atlanticothrix silvestris TaxID=2840444 RepID=UPI00298F233A|nr:CHASE2 domain-containing protein [Atlanticothrix silvestris]
MGEPTIYTVGGTVQAGGGVYIPRQADEELLGLCRSAIFTYVLTPRQMGKSSLMVRTAQTLTAEGIKAVIVDLQELGANVTAEQWYFGFLVKLDDQLMLDTDVVSWWQEHEHLGVSQRLTLFFEQVLLAEVEGQIVVFVDEIDSTLSLDFTDDFFTAIRYLYVARATNVEFNRLSFVLMGVATPGDLIRDAKRTPFNIGTRVDLTDFTFEEALPLAEGLGLPDDEARQVLRWVLKWTGGHPYLTQRLCGALVTNLGDREKLAKSPRLNINEKDVDKVVSSTFFGGMSERDNNLQFVRDMLTKRAPNLFGVLNIYREIISGKHIIIDEKQSVVKSHLKLSGIVRVENSRLRLRNLIYGTVFNDKWLKQHLPVPLKMLSPQRLVLISVVVTLLTLAMRQLGVLQAWELKAYDQMLRSRPVEPLDPRILLVTITEEDLAREKWPLSDTIINQLLLKLESYQPRVIGLNLYRPEQKNLATGLKNQNNIISTCLLSSAGRSEIPPPPNFNQGNIGYSDLIPDSQVDQIVRRALLFAHSTDNKCTTSFSFAALTAVSYLEKQGLEIDFPYAADNFNLGKITFQTLEPNSGSYKGLDARGYQILLNYRQSDRLAQQVTLTQVLNNQLNPNWVKDRLVIIGINAASLHPGLYTPYSASAEQPARMPAVLIHAQIASQLLSTVLDGRPLIWYWPEWGVFLWVWGWSLVGGLLTWRLQRTLYWLIATGGATASLYIICLIFFMLSGWIPLIPSMIAMAVTSVSVVASQITLQKEQQLKISELLRYQFKTACRLRGEDMTDVMARLITEYIEQNEATTSRRDGKSHKPNK